MTASAGRASVREETTSMVFSDLSCASVITTLPGSHPTQSGGSASPHGSAATGRQYCGSMAAASDSPPASCVLGRAGADRVAVVDLDAGGSVVERTELAEAQLPEFVRAREAESRGSGTRESGRTPPRWVFSDTPKWYPPLLAAGVSIDR